jgi:hypothetical protein
VAISSVGKQDDQKAIAAWLPFLGQILALRNLYAQLLTGAARESQ